MLEDTQRCTNAETLCIAGGNPVCAWDNLLEISQAAIHGWHQDVQIFSGVSIMFMSLHY